MTSSAWAEAAHLVRRLGFGATGTEVDAAVRVGPGALVRAALAQDGTHDPGNATTPAPSFESIPPVGKAASADQRHAHNQQVARQLLELAGWWVHRMVATGQPTVEKLTFGWHNHFATAATKVRHAGWLLAQNETLRSQGRGDFGTLARSMLTDAAMLFWLDGQKNVAGSPNENLSREFMELFALGHGAGYTETDVREGARALTGWRIRSGGAAYFDATRHDSGTKSVLGVTGDLDTAGYCAAVLAQPASPRHVATRWWGQLVSDTAPPPAALDAMVSAYGDRRDLTALFTTMLTRPEFAAARGTLVIGPVEWLVGAARALRVPVADTATVTRLLRALRGLGQVPFYPPNVSGWPSGQAWLSTAAADARMQIALELAGAGDLSPVADAPSASRLDAVAHLLGVGTWSTRTAGVLRGAAADPVHLVTAALNSPEYLVH